MDLIVWSAQISLNSRRRKKSTPIVLCQSKQLQSTLITVFLVRNLDDITSADRTILLASNASQSDTSMPNTEYTEAEDSCRIRINGQAMCRIRHCTLVCDCNRIEIFGAYEEYCRTVDGELLDEFDGTKSYLFEIKLAEPVGNVSLKVNRSYEIIGVSFKFESCLHSL